MSSATDIPIILSKTKAERARAMKWEFNRQIGAFEPEFIISGENEKILLKMAQTTEQLKELQKRWPLYVKNPDFPTETVAEERTLQ